MSNGFGGRGSGKVVPLEVAQQLLEQRDELVSRLQKAKRRIDELEANRDSLEIERDECREEMQRARSEAEQLREQLAEQSAGESEESQKNVEEEFDDGVVARLQERIDRLNADLKRVRNRTAETVDSARRDERVRLLTGLGDVLDAVDRAVEMTDDDTPWHQGLQGIRSQMMAFLKAEGASTTGEPGEKMNPELHRAVSTVESSEHETGTITRVPRPGLVLEDGTVVRAADVVVAK